MNKIYPRKGDTQTVYLNAVVKDPSIEVGDYTIYNDFISDPRQFEQNNVLYHYPINHERLIIGKFCSIACGVKFLFNCANHTLKSLSTYTFPLFYEDWELEKSYPLPCRLPRKTGRSINQLVHTHGCGKTDCRYALR